MKTLFRFYSSTLGFKYFDNLEQVSKYYFKHEFLTGSLSLIYGATIVSELDEKKIAEEIYYTNNQN